MAGILSERGPSADSPGTGSFLYPQLVPLARFLHPAADSTSCFGCERSPLVVESRYKALIQEPHPRLLLATTAEWLPRTDSPQQTAASFDHIASEAPDIWKIVLES